MARNSPLRYLWEDGKLINLALANTDATHSPPTKLELEIFRIFQEHLQLQAENKKLQAKSKKLSELLDRAIDIIQGKVEE